MDTDSSERFVLLNHLAEEFAARYRKDIRTRQKAKDKSPKPTGALALHFASPPVREARG